MSLVAKGNYTKTWKFLKIICDWSILFRISLTYRKKYLQSLQVTIKLCFEPKKNWISLCYGNEAGNGRSSPSKVFLGKGILKIYSKCTGEHLCQSVISIKLQSNFIEIALQHGCSSVNFPYIFRAPFPKNTSGGAASKWSSLVVTALQQKVVKNFLEFVSKFYWYSLVYL